MSEPRPPARRSFLLHPASGWIVSLALGLVALWLWLRPGLATEAERSAPLSPPAATSPATPTSTPAPPSEPTALRQCLAELSETKARLPLPPEEPTEAANQEGVAIPDDAGITSIEQIDAGAPPSPKQRAIDERHRAATLLLERELDLSSEESTWTVELVCSLRELRQQALVEASEEDDLGPETWARLEDERKGALGNLEEMLGAERYTKLRGIGGIGLLSDTLNCE